MAKRKLRLEDFEGANSLNMPSASNTRGIADPAALQALAWGEDYDVDARRNAIAAALLERAVAAPTAAAAPGFDQLTAGLGGQPDYRFGGSGDYGMGAGPAPSPSQGGQSFTDMLGGKPGSFFAGQPPGPSVINPDRAPVAPTPTAPRSFAPDDEGEKATPDARTTDQIIEGMVTAMKADMPAAPTPDTVTPGAPTAPTAPTAPAPAGTYAPTAPGFFGAPPSGNLFEGGGFQAFGKTLAEPGSLPGVPSAVTDPVAPPGGFPGEHSDVPSAAPTAPTGDPIAPTSVTTTSFTAPTGWSGAFGMPGAGGFAPGMGQQGSTAGKGAGMPGGGAILGEGGKGWSGAAVTPGGRGGEEGQGEQDTGDKEGEGGDRGGRSAADFDRSFDAVDAANAATAAQAGIALGIPGFDEGSGALAAQSAGKGGTMTSTTALTDPGTSTMSRGGGWGGGGMVSMATTQGMPSPGGFFGSGFSPQGKADVVAGPSLSDTGDPTGWGDQSVGQTPDASLGALGAAVGAAALGAGGSTGFGGMGAMGGVGPGGLNTGGTGEIGSVADPGGGGMAGAGQGGSVSGAGGIGGQGFSSESGGPGALGGGMGGGGGAAGGSSGFGGMGATGAVGGMSTGGTGETGSVADGGLGGIAGAGMGGALGTGDFSSGDFSGPDGSGASGPGGDTAW